MLLRGQHPKSVQQVAGCVLLDTMPWQQRRTMRR
jgi:hypothetical protein